MWESIRLHTETHTAEKRSPTNSEGIEEPLVSIGIPTFNRAALLDRRLQNVVSQTYRNVEIIISDNASSSADVQSVIQKWSALDPRIRSYRQENNLGVHRNFLFVMEKATGPYFIWASDDDEWDENFLYCSVLGIGNAQLFMPNMATYFMTTGIIEEVNAPSLGFGLSPFENATKYLSNMQPGIIYGLHELDSLKRDMPNEVFDLADALMVYRAVLDKGVTIGGGAQYRAGVPETVYKIKPSGRPGSVGKLSYRSFFFGCVRATLDSRHLSIGERCMLILLVVQNTISIMNHLTKTYPEAARKHHVLLSGILSHIKTAKGLLRSVVTVDRYNK